MPHDLFITRPEAILPEPSGHCRAAAASTIIKTAFITTTARLHWEPPYYTPSMATPQANGSTSITTRGCGDLPHTRACPETSILVNGLA